MNVIFIHRYDVIHKSESMAPEERQQFVDKVWSPLETMKKLQETRDPAELNKNENPDESITVPPNHKSNADEDYASTEKYSLDAQKIVGTTTESECDDCRTTIVSKEMKVNDTESNEDLKDIDTVEGFKRFDDSVS